MVWGFGLGLRVDNSGLGFKVWGFMGLGVRVFRGLRVRE